MRMFGWGSTPDAADQSRGSFSGYLWKMKRTKKTVVPQWAKRWYSIEGRNLRWYNSPSSETFSGEIDLASLTGVSRFESGEKGVNSFIVSCPDRNLLLRASSPAEMKMWVRALQMQANLATGGNGTGILCKVQGSGDVSSVSLQKKLRSSTLESELDRKMVELDNLERSISDVTGDAQGNKMSKGQKPPPPTEGFNKVRSSFKAKVGNKFDYVVGEKANEREGSTGSGRRSSSRHHDRDLREDNSRDKEKSTSRERRRGSTREDYEYKDNDYDVDILERDDRGPECDSARVRRLQPAPTRHSKRSSGDHTTEKDPEDDALWVEPRSNGGFSAPKYVDKHSSRNAWI